MGKISRVVEYFYVGRQYLLESLLHLFNILYIRVYLIILLFFNLLLWIFVYFINSQAEDDLVALHYNVDFGINLIGQVEKIYLLPISGLMIIFINFIIIISTQKYYKDSKFVIFILLSAVVFLHLFLIMAAASLYLINFQ